MAMTLQQRLDAVERRLSIIEQHLRPYRHIGPRRDDEEFEKRQQEAARAILKKILEDRKQENKAPTGADKAEG